MALIAVSRGGRVSVVIARHDEMIRLFEDLVRYVVGIKQSTPFSLNTKNR